MRTIEELKGYLNLGEYGEDFLDYEDGYICDVVSEIADNNIDDYDSQLWDWAKENEGYIDDAISEGFYTIDRNDFDLMKLFRAGQYLYIAAEIDKCLDDIIKNRIYKYILEDLNIEEIDDVTDDYIDDLCNNINNDLRIENILEEVKEHIIFNKIENILYELLPYELLKIHNMYCEDANELDNLNKVENVGTMELANYIIDNNNSFENVEIQRILNGEF